MSRQRPFGQDKYWSWVVHRMNGRKLTSPRLHGLDVLIVGKLILGLRDKVVGLDPYFKDGLQLALYYTAEVC